MYDNSPQHANPQGAKYSPRSNYQRILSTFFTMAESLVSLMEDMLECESKGNVQGLICLLDSMLEATALQSNEEIYKFVAKKGKKLLKLKKTHEHEAVRRKAAELVGELRRKTQLHLAKTSPQEHKNSHHKAPKIDQKDTKPDISFKAATGREVTCSYCLNIYASERGLSAHLRYAREAGCRQHGFDFDKAYGVRKPRERRELEVEDQKLW
jgi:hypothetical protein